VELGYARVSTAKQDLDRQLHALAEVGIPAERTFVDKKSGSTTDRPRAAGTGRCWPGRSPAPTRSLILRWRGGWLRRAGRWNRR
jgi:hypothetical protein